MSIRYYLKKSKDVHISEMISAVPMLFALFLSVFYKRKYHNTWVVCERDDEACDNGYHFFKYLRKYHPEKPCFYVMKRKSSSYSKVHNLGQIVEPGSLQHWILYFTAEYLISSQSCKPNAYLCTYFERKGIFHVNQVFLQHGVTINKAEYLMYRRRPVKYFITAAAQETEFVQKTLGYPQKSVLYTGFARFDALHDFSVHKNRILIMPTWRKWLKLKSEQHNEADSTLETSEYFIKWAELLNNEQMGKLINEYNLEVIFCPHSHIKELFDRVGFHTKIRIADLAYEDLQELMKSSEMLITDYSSIFFDMVYMKKPVLFYQFDYDKFRRFHYGEGWFHYRESLFGKSFSDYTEVLGEMERLIKCNYRVSEGFIREHARTFELYDCDNCKRIYEALDRKGRG